MMFQHILQIISSVIKIDSYISKGWKAVRVSYQYITNTLKAIKDYLMTFAEGITQ